MTQLNTISLEDKLGLIAMRFRGAKDEASRTEAVAEYTSTLKR